ncbi:hypothetical protein ABIA32_002224 [Streptacidiphilus sp. MAP12-20]|uniref:hypothetical protein n=1 Tax=Streptacidiphilus sp. MAP12-20 TaxID=3156299 RepID=UPI0035150AC3
MDRPGGPGPLLEWGVVANVAEETFHGPDGAERQAGLRHFRAGARVWVLPPRYRDEDEQVEVIGFHRGSHSRLINFIVFRRHLERFRTKAVYNPTVVLARENSPYWN